MEIGVEPWGCFRCKGKSVETTSTSKAPFVCPTIMGDLETLMSQLQAAAAVHGMPGGLSHSPAPP